MAFIYSFIDKEHSPKPKAQRENYSWLELSVFIDPRVYNNETSLCNNNIQKVNQIYNYEKKRMVSNCEASTKLEVTDSVTTEMTFVKKIMCDSNVMKL